MMTTQRIKIIHVKLKKCGMQDAECRMHNSGSMGREIQKGLLINN